MIRFLIYLIVFVAGLAAAMFWLGEMRLVRQAIPDRLPVWSNVIAPDARLVRGSARLTVPQLTATWTAVAPSAEGLNWDLRVNGPGIAVQAKLVMPWWPRDGKIASGRGTIDAAALVGDAGGAPIRIEALTGSVPILDRAGRVGFLEATLSEGATLPPLLLDQPLVRYNPDTRVLRIPLVLP